MILSYGKWVVYKETVAYIVCSGRGAGFALPAEDSASLAGFSRSIFSDYPAPRH